jgi:uncharacterized membrane protein
MNIWEVLLIFILGSFFGKLYETLKKNFTKKRNLRVGFLNGPYLPLYGFGGIIVLFISYLNINFIAKIILFTTSITLLEFVTGKFFRKKHIKLWDYSEYKWNYQGIICIYSLVLWAVLASAFYIFIFPFFGKIAEVIFDKTIFKILILSFYIILLIDFKSAIKKIKN